MTHQNLLTKTFQLISMVVLVGSIFAVGAGFILHLLPRPVARAAGTIDVTTTSDEYDTSGSGSGCSLREAIESINTSSSFGGCNNPANAADTIQLQAMTYTLSIPYPTSPPFDDSNMTGDIEPKKSMTILGAGSRQTVITTTATYNHGVFHPGPVSPNSVIIIIEGMTIQGGKSNGVGGGIFVPASAANSMLILTDVIIENNRSGFGGGIYLESGTLILNEVIIRNNRATGGSFSHGGGILLVSGDVSLNNVTLEGNQANSGGAIFVNDYLTTFLTNTLQMTNVTIYDNEAQTSGGGLYLNLGQYPPWTSGVPIAVIATNVTFANNRALSGSGGNIYNNAATVGLKNTIIANGLANGSPNNCAGNPLPNLTSLGHNLDSGNTCGLTTTGDITNTDPLLAALADNGGSTPTLALLSGSPAIDTGTCSSAPSTDQRGVARPQGSTCDIGAYEASTQPNFVLTKTVDDASPSPGQRITYTVTVQNNGSLSATNTLISDTLSSDLSLAGPVKLDPPGTLFTPTLPILASGLTLTPGQSITLTMPVTVNTGLADGTIITNTAAVTSTEVITPQVGAVSVTVFTQPDNLPKHTYLPTILKN
jgi:uncharacterized repeat protein (TIGR01451 family)/CSLREA domain-containing protein